MAKKKTTRKKSASPATKKKVAKKKPAAKKKAAKKKTAKTAKKAVKKKRRPRSRGKSRNTKTATKHAVNQVEATANGTEQPSNPEVPIPESYRPGPSVSLLDGTDSINRERQVIQKMLDHDEWQIPGVAFEMLPTRLVQMALNMGDLKDKKGNVIEENVPDAGTWSTNQQLTAMRILERFHAHNLKKLTALKPSEVRVLNEQPTTVTVEDQRLAAIAAITAELSRRQSGGKISGQPVIGSVGDSPSGDDDADSDDARPVEA